MNNEVLLAVLIALIPSAAFGAVIQAIITGLKARRDRNDITLRCFKMLFLDLLDRQADLYKRQGYITKTQWMSFEESYHIYHDPDKLNGNGYAKRAYEDVQKLEIRDDD